MTAKRTALKRIATAVIAIAVVAAVVAMFSHMSRKEAERREKIETANAVSVLPEGTEQRWSSYVDQRLADAIKRQGDVLKVTSLVSQYTDSIIYVSRNTPFQISCDPIMGSDVSFGHGKDAVNVPIYGMLINEEGETAPKLGVSGLSIAAKNLSEKMCARISDYMQKVTASH